MVFKPCRSAWSRARACWPHRPGSALLRRPLLLPGGRKSIEPMAARPASYWPTPAMAWIPMSATESPPSASPASPASRPSPARPGAVAGQAPGRARPAIGPRRPQRRAQACPCQGPRRRTATQRRVAWREGTSAPLAPPLCRRSRAPRPPRRHGRRAARRGMVPDRMASRCGRTRQVPALHAASHNWPHQAGPPRYAALPTDSWSPKGPRSPPRPDVPRHPSKHLPFPRPGDHGEPPIWPERHVANPIATMQATIKTALARRLPRCPCCVRLGQYRIL